MTDGAGSWLDDLTPAQDLLVTDLLGRGQARPGVDFGLAARLRARLETSVEPHAEGIPDGEELFLGKTALSALGCEGRFIDLQDSEFSWSLPIVKGKLGHKALEVDWHTGRQLDTRAASDRAMQALVEEGGSIAEWLDELGETDRQLLLGESAAYVAEFRDTWPLLPAGSNPRLEQPMRVGLAGGRIKLAGTPDLLLGTANKHEARMLLVDFKTGLRRPTMERQDLRFYGLLSTLKYGVAPWRWATFYVAECAWDLEDASEELLSTAVDRVVDAVKRAVRLRWHAPPDDQLVLSAGPACNWCGRRSTCPAKAEADEHQLMVGD